MKKEKSLETILVLVLALMIFYLVSKRPWLLYTALVIGSIGILVPALAEKIHWAWMKLSQAMGYVMGKVLLTVIFLVFLLPLSLLSRAFGKNSLKLKQGQPSYFKVRNFTYDRDSLEHVW